MGDGGNARASWRTTRCIAGQPGDLHTDGDAAYAGDGPNARHRELNMDVDFPYRIDGRGRTGEADRDNHIRDMIEQVLFTSPGERVNRPDFGTGLMQLVFAPNSDELAATLQVLIRSALQQWLGDRIQVDDVVAESRDAVLSVSVRYTVLLTQETGTAQFSRGV
jgi:uncharacterized protein